MTAPPDRILIVEDDPPLREVLAQALAKEGFDVRAAPNGRDALNLLQRGFVPSLVLVDIRMPQMDGFSFLVEMKRTPLFGHVPAIGMSALGVKAEDANLFDGWASKPLDLDRLLVQIAEHIELGRRRLAEQETRKSQAK